jgi:Putative SAM-dependent methyltransferase
VAVIRGVIQRCTSSSWSILSACLLSARRPFQSEAKTIADSLSLPLISDVSLDGSEESFSHALRLVEYKYGGVVSHALAIESLDSGAVVDTYTIMSNINNKSLESIPQRRPKKKCRTKTNPFFIDLFPDPKSRVGKRSQGQAGTDLLVKAVAPQKVAAARAKQTLSSLVVAGEERDHSPNGAVIYDLTAGFAQDSLILALSGRGDCQIHMVERDPIVAALLTDALRRLHLLAKSSQGLAPHEAELALDLSQRLTLEVGEGKDIVRQLAARTSFVHKDDNDDGRYHGQLLPDIVYLDPMFPPRTKSASVKKNMQILHGLLQTQQPQLQQKVLKGDVAEEDIDVDAREEQDLLEAALNAAKARVVVKRPIHALALGHGSNGEFLKPSYSINGSVNRFDVYLTG